MATRIVSAPGDYPVTVEDARSQLRLDSSDFDTQLTLLIAAETAYAEKFTGRKFVSQSWDCYLDAFPQEGERQVIVLPFPKIISVDGVYYQDSSGGEQTLDADLYVADLAGRPGRIGLAQSASWPQTIEQINAVRIRVTVGEQDTTVSPATTDVAKDIQLAILLRVQAAFDGGEQMARLQEIADNYLIPHRTVFSLA